MSEKEEKLRESIDDLKELEGVQGAAVVRSDGLLITDNFPGDVDSDQLAAMTASTMGSGETASETLEIGAVTQVVIEAEAGKLVSTGAGENAILTVMADSDVNMGLILVQMEETASDVSRIL